MMALRVDVFRPFAKFVEAVDRRFSEIKAVPPAPGFKEVLIPGEPEARAKALRLKGGIPIPEDTWDRMVATGEKYKIHLNELIRNEVL